MPKKSTKQSTPKPKTAKQAKPADSVPSPKAKAKSQTRFCKEIGG